MFSIESVHTNIVTGRQVKGIQKGSYVRFSGSGWFYVYEKSVDGSPAEATFFTYPQGIDDLTTEVLGTSQELDVGCMMYSEASGLIERYDLVEIWRMKSVKTKELKVLFRLKGEALLTNTGEPVELEPGDVMELVLIGI